jgi:hypothetical protein
LTSCTNGTVVADAVRWHSKSGYQISSSAHGKTVGLNASES